MAGLRQKPGTRDTMEVSQVDSGNPVLLTPPLLPHTLSLCVLVGSWNRSWAGHWLKDSDVEHGSPDSLPEHWSLASFCCLVRMPSVFCVSILSVHVSDLFNVFNASLY